MAYEPQPGTIPHKAIAWLRAAPAGCEPSTAELCDALDLDPASFSAYMVQAIRNGIVKSRKRDGMGKVNYWSLGDGVPLPAEPADTALAVKQTFNAQPASALPPPPPHTKLRPVKQELDVPKFTGHVPAPSPARAPVTERDEDKQPLVVPTGVDTLGFADTVARGASAPRPRQPFDAWLSGVTGELVLQGVQIDADGDAVLSFEQSEFVRRLYAGEVFS